MNAPYNNVGEADQHRAFLTGADGHDKATLMRRTIHSHENYNQVKVLTDEDWQRMVWLIDAAPALLKSLQDVIAWLDVEPTPEDPHDAATLDSMLHYAKVARDRATGYPGETD
jgi:hypothetical protein